jgi:CubicO group peptidase (beta-lactamase class C family)
MVRMKLRFSTYSSSIAAVAILASTAFCDLPVTPPKDVGLSSQRLEQVSTFVDSLVASGEVPGAVAIVAYKGKVVFRKVAGLAERDPKRPMSYDTIFRLASMTKPLTSTAVLMLLEEGKIALDDPVAKYIPEFGTLRVVTEQDGRPAQNEMTVRHLLTHTSGLANNSAEKVGEQYMNSEIVFGVESSPLTLDADISRLGRIPLLFEPGERFQYGLSTDVLGLVVERASGLKFDEFIENRICKPLGMNDTYFHIPKGKQHRLVAANVADDSNAEHLRELGDTERIRNRFFRIRMSPDYPTSTSNRYHSGGGGMSGTAEDYLRFCLMIRNRGQLDGLTLLQPSTVDMMTTNQIGDLNAGVVGMEFKFGFGFAILPRTEDTRDEIFWGGVWGTRFQISKGADWIAILMTQRAFDQKQVPREVEFVRLVREAIQGNEGR